MHVVEGKSLHKIKIEERQVGNVLEPVGLVRPSITRMVRYDDLVALSEFVHERQPYASSACSMEK
jgi:hypothetical protein